ncbi:DUF2975 domain-containing protein [Conexibacter sp. SYSU D00693]|uniref:DUF2975 domain-containing protein n=1 Tax=Conexibacter sp. SYSU D00693 TaxID=2812560 RepID=UPI00196AED09|nr:DUF2975 domain-containing protein [Conexibacter sp. SYSU D00693]
MDIERRAVTALRVFLVVLFGILLLLQVMSLPGQFAHMAEEEPDLAYLRWPLTVVTIFWVFCAQVVVVSTWKLLDLVRADRIFSDASWTWVDAIVLAIAAAWTTFLGFFLYVGFKADDPGMPLLLFLLLLALSVVGLVMLVMRALLRQATNLRTEVEAVI